MRTNVLSCTAENFESSLKQAVEVLRCGGLVAFPTETVYGLGAAALDSLAVAKIFTAKGRPAANPLIVHISEVGHVSQVTSSFPEKAKQLAGAFWPGPLTLVVPKGREVPDLVTAGGKTVAVRIPDHPVALALLRAFGKPIAAPSANLSNRLSATRADHVLRDLDGRIDLILDGGPTLGGIESTVLDVTQTTFRLLRPGLIDPAALEHLVGPIERGNKHPDENPLPSPGMLSRHYAPRTPLDCVEDDGLILVAELSTQGFKVALVTWRKGAAFADRVVHLPADPAGYASGLYSCLHQLDEEGFDRIVVALPPDDDSWLAVRDRLRRASAPGD